MSEIQVTIFRTPSGDVAGVATASILALDGRPRHIARATIHVSKAPTVTVDMPRELSLADFARANAVLQAFEARLFYLAAAHGLQQNAGGLPELSPQAALRKAATELVRYHLAEAEVHPCDVHNDDIRAQHCMREVQALHEALKR